ncbi:MAG: hypothetical protein KBC83_00135 [Candidatus Moranbacteria bacterium]|jgi:hypothetical protein|nr:hypothetical protein [Candidatus Moranbacteria bacterium]MBP9801065.1 hypothetical protein [Candidatus Moranbacteria bacterium]
MKIIIPHPSENSVSIMRRAGYIFQRAANGEQSFIRPLARSGYPRFHAYVKIENGDLLLNMHLDQKRETYGEDTRHHGEYGNEGALKEESVHLLRLFGPNAHIV